MILSLLCIVFGLFSFLYWAFPMANECFRFPWRVTWLAALTAIFIYLCLWVGKYAPW